MSETVRLRPATIEDAQRLFEWRNDPQTRAQSLQQQPVAWESHLAWLQASLRNPNRQLYIAEPIRRQEQGQPLILGTVRADKINEEFELSNPASQRIALSLGMTERQQLETHTVYAGRKPAP